MKARALRQDEVMLLIDLVVKHKVLMSKSTNANSNRLKDNAWRAVAQEFSALTGEVRNIRQIRLKWDNLKKSARVRSKYIKAGGGKTYIIPNEPVDRVAAILKECNDSTCDVGGDGDDPLDSNMSQGGTEDMDFKPLPEETKSEKVYEATEDDNDSAECSSESDKHMLQEFMFKTPKTSMHKRQKFFEEAQRARRDKDLAIAAYFQAKAEKINLENIKLKLEIKQLRRGNSGVTQIIINDNE